MPLPSGSLTLGRMLGFNPSNSASTSIMEYGSASKLSGDVDTLSWAYTDVAHRVVYVRSRLPQLLEPKVRLLEIGTAGPGHETHQLVVPPFGASPSFAANPHPSWSSYRVAPDDVCSASSFVQKLHCRVWSLGQTPWRQSRTWYHRAFGMLSMLVSFTS